MWIPYPTDPTRPGITLPDGMTREEVEAFTDSWRRWRYGDDYCGIPNREAVMAQIGLDHGLLMIQEDPPAFMRRPAHREAGEDDPE